MSGEAWKPWRDEYLTKGEVYDILMKVSKDVEEMNTKHVGKKLSKLLKLHLVRDMLEGSAMSLSKDHLQLCGGYLGTKLNTAHPDCKSKDMVHSMHYIQES